MKKLGDIFSSAAKTDILCALYHQPDSVGLRQIARIADVRVRSAELALDSLVDAKLVQRVLTANRTFYKLARNDPRAKMLSEVVDAATFANIHAECRSVAGRAPRILPFIAQANRMLAHAKEDRK